MDSDDYIDENYLEILYKSIQKNNADISMCVNDVVSEASTTHKKRMVENKKIISLSDKSKILNQLLDDTSKEHLGYYLPE